MAAVAERVIRANLTPEAQWRDWLALRGTAPLDTERWIGTDRRLVVVAPHPDDEVIAAGGLLSQHANLGRRCHVIAVTDGEASHEGCAPHVRAMLAQRRRDESERGLAQLDVSAEAVTRLGLPDGKVTAHAGRLREALQPLLQADDIVVTTWRLDGHPDHDATGEATAEVCDAIGATLVEAPVWMWHWSQPGDPRVPWHRLRPLPLSAPAHGRKISALAEHASQLCVRQQADGSRQGAVLDAAILRRVARRSEYFFV